ncbi:hypothetical protein B0F90DRAFT_1738050 [Multifurca ochricompacta]|uniref:Uncharacterized protein n=1 Tax=Multifurca ochricompacta TaxID=376703 RepID=A0AAD4M164_9AGAM|nr:hypothetical protein B0F90DRAFT_1738050 [Multifurca ochricompacta]
MRSDFSNMFENQQCANTSRRIVTAFRRMSSGLTGSQEESTRSNDNSIRRPRFSRGERHGPDPCSSQCVSSSQGSFTSEKEQTTAAFVDRDSGVVFSHLYKANGERITVQEFQRKTEGELAPTLRLVIPSSPSTTPAYEEKEEENSGFDLPCFALTIPSPSSPRSPVIPPSPMEPFTRVSYITAAACAPSTMRVPYLPQFCPHTIRPHVSPRSCQVCTLQLLACDIWWYSRCETRLCAPLLLPATLTPTTRAIYYALELPLGNLDQSCIDWDVVEVILFMRRGATAPAANASPRSCKGHHPVVQSVRVSSRIRMLLRRARHIMSAPTRVPMIPTPNMAPRRRAIVRR